MIALISGCSSSPSAHVVPRLPASRHKLVHGFMVAASPRLLSTENNYPRFHVEVPLRQRPTKEWKKTRLLQLIIREAPQRGREGYEKRRMARVGGMGGVLPLEVRSVSWLASVAFPLRELVRRGCRESAAGVQGSAFDVVNVFKPPSTSTSTTPPAPHSLRSQIRHDGLSWCCRHERLQ